VLYRPATMPYWPGPMQCSEKIGGFRLTRRDPIGVQLLAFINDMLQLTRCTAGNCPFEVCGKIFGDVLGRELAGVAYASYV
jgi:hypothetical protein